MTEAQTFEIQQQCVRDVGRALPCAGLEKKGPVSASERRRVKISVTHRPRGAVSSRRLVGADQVLRVYETALALSASNSACVIAPWSSSSLALAISAADPPAASRTYWSNAAF